MSSERSPVSTRLILGIGITAIGVALLLDRLGLFYAEHLTRYWPVIVIAIGLKILFEAARTGRWAGGAIVTLLGIVFLGNELGLFDVGVRELWPLFLVLAGLGILSRGFGGRSAERGGSTDDRISEFGILCALNPKVASQSFKGGEVNAFMGGVEVDLRHAEVAEEGAVIVVFAMMGGIGIIVPPDWTVNTYVTPLMGGMEDTTESAGSDPAKQLTVKGFVMMGGIEVKN